MATAKQQEEKRIKNLRRMVALPHNRNCFDCGQRGPTYVNMTVGAYVCTACSGIVRGLNPPHRVKSVSMGSFTQEEIDTLTERGNEYNREVWLAHHDTKLPPEFDTKDELKLRDYMIQKYERKRWHAPAAPGLAEKAKLLNSQSTNSSNANTTSTRRPVTGAFKMPGPPGSVPKVQVPLPTNSTPAPPVSAAVTAPVSSQAAPSTDLLADVFSSGSTTAAAPNQNNFTQPDFANFGSANVAAAAPIATSTNQPAAPSLFPTDSDPMDSLTGPLDTGPAGNTSTLVDYIPAGAGLPVAAPVNNSNQWSTLSSDPNQGGDKYASLTGLFANTGSSGAESIQAPVVASNPPPVAAATNGVNWNSINWGASSDPMSSQGQAMSWGGAAPTGTQPQAAGGVTGSGVFGQPPVSSIQPNPAAASGWGAGVPSTGVNPFLVSSTVTQPQAGGFGQAGGAPSYPGGAPFNAFSTTQPSAAVAPQPQLSSGFAYQQPQQPNPFSSGPAQTSSGFGGFPPNPTPGVPQVAGGFPGAFHVQNGTTPKQWGAQPQQPAPQWGTQNQWGTGAAPATQWSAGPAKPAANPFLAQAPQGAVGHPAGTVTNPFL